METELSHTYHAASNRLFLFDYDGTLTPLMPTPPEAAPSPALKQDLARLANNPHNTVVIISGRDRETLDSWFGDLPLSFAAEHGHWRKVPNKDWEAMNNDDGSWRPTVGKLMLGATTACEGSFVEEKTSALAWHYRQANNESLAQHTTSQLLAELNEHREELGIRIINGNKVVEVQAAGTNKGTAAQFWLNAKKWDFILAAGDDTTDEDLFNAMPESAFTIKIGDAASIARMRIASPAGLVALLRTFSM